MKKLADLLPRMPGSPDPDQLIETLLDDPQIRAFVVKNDLTHSVISGSINTLLTFREQRGLCDACLGIAYCSLPHPGMTPDLILQAGQIGLSYRKCRHNKQSDTISKIDAMFVPAKVFEADLADMDLIGDSRREVHRYIVEYLRKFQDGKPIKSLYLTGAYGTGKTFLLAAIANELAKLGKEVVFAYYPDLTREMKSSIGSGTLEEKIARLKAVDILMLDDIGGEQQSGFIRDEVLGPILQHRVLDKKPTFFSSNFKMMALIDAMALSTSTVEKTKSARIFERIRDLATEIEIREKPVRSA
jgi:primosomal protein DnaI